MTGDVILRSGGLPKQAATNAARAGLFACFQCFASLCGFAMVGVAGFLPHSEKLAHGGRFAA
jgi:hypothetical protein